MKIVRITLENMEIAKLAYHAVLDQKIMRGNKDFFGDTNNYFFVVYDNDYIVGLMVGYALESPDVSGKQLYIQAIEVKPLYRQKGYAKALVQLFMDTLEDHKFSKIFTFVDKPNTPAIKLYDSFVENTFEKQVLNQFLYTWESK